MEHTDSEGRTALTHAAMVGHSACLEYLIRVGCNIHAADLQGGTALHHAAAVGSVQMIKALLDASADPLMPDLEGKAP